MRLPAERADDIVDVMADAFRGYPVIRFVAAGDGTPSEPEAIEARERVLVDLFVRRRIRRQGPAFGVVAGGALAGAAIMTLPVEADPPPGAKARAAEAWRALGDDALRRYEEYSAAADLFGALPPHHHLNMIGVRRAFQGQGLARPLIEATLALTEADPGSAGLTLTTDKPQNVEIYRHFGFEVIGQGRIPGATGGAPPRLETWGMFRRIR